MQIHNVKSNQLGFLNVILITLMPLFLICGIGVMHTLSLIEIKSLPKNICRTNLLRTQSKTKSYLEKLLSLNFEAEQLRIKLSTMKIKLSQAILISNVPAIAYYEAQIARITSRQLVLDSKQRKIITSADINLLDGSNTARQEIMKSLKLKKNLFSYWLDIKFSQSSHTINLAVIPNDPGLAPTYRVKNNFLDEQTIQQSWIITMSGKEFVKKFIHSEFEFKESCQASIEQRNGLWTERLVADKQSRNF